MKNRTDMKLAFVLFVFLSALLLIRSNSSAFKNEPEGFRNIKLSGGPMSKNKKI